MYLAKPKLLVLHGKKNFSMPTFAESDSVREEFDIIKDTMIGNHKPDIVYCQSYGQCCTQLLKWKGPSVVLVCADPWQVFRQKKFSDRLNQIRRLLERTTTVLCLSKFLQGTLQSNVDNDGMCSLPRGLWGMDHTINGVQPNRFEPKTNWDIDDRPIAILSIVVSDISPAEKWREIKWWGIPIFLQAVSRVVKKYNVGIINSAWSDLKAPQVKMWKEKWGIEFARHHCRRETVDHWPWLLRSADIFIHPGMHDSWGRVIADAMCAAVPSLVFDVTGQREVGDSLLFCDPDDPRDIENMFDGLLQDRVYREEVAKHQHAEALALTEAHRGDIAKVLLSTLEGKTNG